MSKAFDKVWHEGLIYKLRQVGISGDALTLINSFLNNRFQRVILNGQSSNWLPVKAGDGVEDYVCFTKLRRLAYHCICQNTYRWEIIFIITN